MTSAEIAVRDKYSALFTRKPEAWDTVRQVKLTVAVQRDLDGLRVLEPVDAYGQRCANRLPPNPCQADFADEYGPAVFILDDGQRRFVVSTEGASYARYVFELV